MYSRLTPNPLTVHFLVTFQLGESLPADYLRRACGNNILSVIIYSKILLTYLKKSWLCINLLASVSFLGKRV